MKQITLLAVILTCFFSQTVFAATLNVPAGYPTIQAAVDAAASGDTVLLADGVYTGSGNCEVVVPKSISIVSKNGPDNTIIDCPDSSYGFNLNLTSDYNCPQQLPGHSVDHLQNGETYYTDRDYTLTGVPSQYVGMWMFPNPDDDRDNTAASGYITFGAYCDLVVYVAYDSRATALPGWMAGFSYTGDNLYTSLAAQDHLKIYSRTYSSGECVNLGANKAPGFAGGEVDNYVVFYSEDGPCTEVSLDGLKIQNTGTAVRAWGQPFLSYFWNSRPYLLHNCALTDNSSGVSAFQSSGTIDDCSITGCGGPMYFEYAGADIRDCRILNNYYGIGGLDGWVTLNRCMISGNSDYGINMTESGVGLYNSIVSFNSDYGLMIDVYSIARIINSTVFGNVGGLSYGFENNIDITNSIFRQNGIFEIENPDDFNSLNIRNSNLEGGIAGIVGGGPVTDLGGNIDEDPRFVDPDGPDNIAGTADDDLHLGSGSLCINAGTTDLPDGDDFEFDIDGDPRIVGPAPDMGADEYTRNFTFYRDRDRDGYGNPKKSVQAATRPRGYVSDNTDCNDRKKSVHPGARERCNHRDDDCDGLIDEYCHCKPCPHHKHHTGRGCDCR